MKTVRAITAVLTVFILSICGANAAQHPGKSAPALNVPALVAPIGLLAKPAASERMVVAQRRRRGRVRRRGARRAVRRGRSVRRSRRNRRRAIGAAAATAAIIGLGIAASQSRAEPHYGSRYCRRMRWRCDDGERWACRKFYRNC